MTDNVVFGEFHKNLDRDHKEAEKLLETALSVEGDEVLSEYEEKFAKDAYNGIVRTGNRWEISPARKEILDRIEKKLEKEGLI